MILQNVVNPSLDPTQPDASELPTFSYGSEGILRGLKQYRFFSASIYFQKYGEVINSINPGDTHMHYWQEYPLTQVMAWFCWVLNQCLNQFSFIINCTLRKWYAKLTSSCLGINVLSMALIFTATTTVIYPSNGYTSNRVKNTRKS